MKKLLIFGLALLFCFCTQEDQKDVVDLVPTDNDISGWIRSSAMEIAENETQLWTIIDGEGVIWVDNEFVKFVRQYFGGDLPAVILELRIADMGDTTNAKNLYDDVEIEYYTSPIQWDENNAGVEARCEMIGYSWILDFWNDKFHAWITISDNSDAALNIAKLFALNIDTAIKNTE